MLPATDVALTDMQSVYGSTICGMNNSLQPPDNNGTLTINTEEMVMMIYKSAINEHAINEHPTNANTLCLWEQIMCNLLQYHLKDYNNAVSMH